MTSPGIGRIERATDPSRRARAGMAHFAGLTRTERVLLRRWLRNAPSHGIDTAEDLTGRAWNEPGADMIIGLFGRGQAFASWLIVHQGESWIAASCGDGRVLAVRESLAEVLAQIATA